MLYTVDMDECRSIPGLCRNGECENVIGSFRCRCPPDFQLSESGRECRGEFFSRDFCSFSIGFFSCLGGAAVGRRTRDRKVAGSTPGRGAIN